MSISGGVMGISLDASAFNYATWDRFSDQVKMDIKRKVWRTFLYEKSLST